jgi:hypothetical protein
MRKRTWRRSRFVGSVSCVFVSLMAVVGSASRPAGSLPDFGTLSIRVAGVAGVPVDASSVALNVIAVDPTAAGFLTVYPCGSTRPDASSVNFVAGETIPNLVIRR